MTQETYNLLEEAVQNELKQIKNVDISTKEGGEVLKLSTNLAQLLITTDKDNADYYDKEEKRRIEEERNKAMESVERDKQKLTWGRVCLEMAKIVVPLAIQIAAFSTLQERMFKFEETGRVTSTGGREMHLPKFWK